MRLKNVLTGHTDNIEMAAFSPDCQRIATCSRDHTIRLYTSSDQPQKVLTGHGADVLSICWSADGKTIVSSSDDGSIRRWDSITGEQLDLIDMGCVETDTVAISRESTLFAGDEKGRIFVVTSSGIYMQRAHNAGIKRIVWDDKKRFLVSLSYDISVILWNLTADNPLEETANTKMPSIVWPRSCAMLGDHHIAFGTFGSSYATAQEWDLTDIEPAISLNPVTMVDEDIYSIGDAGVLHINRQPSTMTGSPCNFLLPFGNSVLTGGQMGTVFDANTGQIIFQHRSPLNCGTTFDRADFYTLRLEPTPEKL